MALCWQNTAKFQRLVAILLPIDLNFVHFGTIATLVIYAFECPGYSRAGLYSQKDMGS